VKSRIHTRKIRVTHKNDTKKYITINEKQIVFYNRQYARCAMAEREDVMLKAKDLIAPPGKGNKLSAQGVAGFMRNIENDKNLKVKQSLQLDKEALKEEEKYDGYYLFISSELNESVYNLVDAYRGLWEIEDAFKYKNSAYRARPVFITRTEHMHAHFLTSYMALAITRILEMKIGGVYSIDQVLHSLNKCMYVNIEGNHYIQSYYDSVLDVVGKNLGVDFSKRYGTLRNIKRSSS
jgi:transposase